MDLHKAIRATHNSVVTINGSSQNNIVATDNNKNERAKEYPSIVDQLDDIYHNGIDGWKATIKITKDKYPKE